MPEITDRSQQVPWYESNLFWGPVPLGTGILLAVVAAMKHDLRWLLWFAAPCFIFASWTLAKRWLRGWSLGMTVLVAGLLICGGMYWIDIWLGRPESSGQNKSSPDTTATVTNQAPPQVGVVPAPSSAPPPTVPPAAKPKHPKHIRRSPLVTPLKATREEKKGPNSSAPVQSQQPPMSQECAPGANCAMSNGQQGGVTAGTYIAGPLPPTITRKVLSENLRMADALFKTDYQLDISTTVPFSLHVRAEAPDVGSTVRSEQCLAVYRQYDGNETSIMWDSATGLGFCEGHVHEATSGHYHVVVHTTKPETITLIYGPD